ncbi:zinc finger Ran-binding domain-containing protein [Saccharopolyspora griseoalba]|uniref:Zinc finger Ran-binding domain-containing protein n=1 Tax=Saccharopolyspora griseoalba TaxID=1431848 RepID=A0ABW2LV69_9PSEU
MTVLDEVLAAATDVEDEFIRSAARRAGVLWSCERCSFDNLAHDMKCDGCQGAKPHSPAVHQSGSDVALEVDFPAMGHMVAVSGRAVFWLADRHASLDGTDVALTGTGRRLLEAPLRGDGIVRFDSLIEHDLAEGKPSAGTTAADAVNVLCDPAAIERVLYPPYIADPTQRPIDPSLQPPDALRENDPLLIDMPMGSAYWLYGLDLVAAPLTTENTIAWGDAAIVDIASVVAEFPRLPEIRNRLLGEMHGTSESIQG